MSIKLELDGVATELVKSRFPAGESHIQINFLSTADRIGVAHIELNYESNDDLIDLALLVDAVKRSAYTAVAFELYMPYLPYARQDRVCNPGESLAVKVICDYINSFNFSRVTVLDIHSDVGAALLNNLCHLKVAYLANSLNMRRDKANTVLVSPDAGANKKVFDFAKARGFTEVVRADKTRNVATGQITGTTVYSEHIGNKDFLIIDDICDGGRTFTELAKELRKLTDGKVMLYVTHGIFSKGMEVFDGLIDVIYTSNLVGAKANEAHSAGKVILI